MDNLPKKLNKTITITATAAIVALAWIVFVLVVPVKTANGEFLVQEGESLKQIAENLTNRHFIKNKTVFVFLIKVLGAEKNLKAGQYDFGDGVSAIKIAYILSKGLSHTSDIKITIPEGANSWDIDKILADAGVIRSGEFAGKFYADEGFLFPDTYFLKKQEANSETEGIREKMKENFKLKTADFFKNLSSGKKKEVVVTASILEKEAKTENDMRLVAGIIAKRLSLGMFLQIDATVSYGACLRNYQYKYCDVSQIGVANEIRIDSEFNTYMRKGLPPVPISNPGLAALSAAARPLKSDYLYYLSTKSGDKIIYSKTPVEHAKNRKKYLGI